MCTGYSVARWTWMPDIIDTMDNKPEKPFTHRLAWFVVLYCAGLLVTGTVVYLLRFLLGLS